MEWISVKDRLPDGEETKGGYEGFIVCVKTDSKYSSFLRLLSQCVDKDGTVSFSVRKAYFDYSQKIWNLDGSYLNALITEEVECCVTHWMPFPEPAED